METLVPWEIVPVFFLVALLYSSVGHGGASGYLAVFTLFGIASPSIAPIVLILNVVVAGTGFWNYRRFGHFSGEILLPFILTSIPASFFGGMVALPRSIFHLLLGITLVLAAVRILWWGTKGDGRQKRKLNWLLALTIGLVIGFLAGAIGIGGGIFLSPILLLARWADVKQTAAVSGAFIVCNSLAGLGGHLMGNTIPWEPAMLYVVPAVFIGAMSGSRLSAGRFPSKYVRIALGIVLLLASVKLLALASG